MTHWNSTSYPTPLVPPETTPQDAKVQALAAMTLLAHTLEQASIALEQGHQAGWEQQINQAREYLGNIQLYAKVALLGDKPDPTAAMRSLVESASVGDWITAYQAQVAITELDPRLPAGEAILGMAALEREGVIRKSNRGGGRAQYQRLK